MWPHCRSRFTLQSANFEWARIVVTEEMMSPTRLPLDCISPACAFMPAQSRLMPTKAEIAAKIAVSDEDHVDLREYRHELVICHCRLQRRGAVKLKLPDDMMT